MKEAKRAAVNDRYEYPSRIPALLLAYRKAGRLAKVLQGSVERWRGTEEVGRWAYVCWMRGEVALARRRRKTTASSTAARARRASRTRVCIQLVHVTAQLNLRRQGSIPIGFHRVHLLARAEGRVGPEVRTTCGTRGASSAGAVWRCLPGGGTRSCRARGRGRWRRCRAAEGSGRGRLVRRRPAADPPTQQRADGHPSVGRCAPWPVASWEEAWEAMRVG